MLEELKVIIKAETDKFKANVEEAEKQTKTFKEQVAEAGKSVDENLAGAGEKIDAGIKVGITAIAAAGAALLALGASTAEYRNEQAKLVTSFETAGGSAETAKNTYNDLFRVIGDSGVATEASAHLAQLTTNQQQLSEWTTICQGVYATFGDSIPIEGLTEAANETAKTGALTGGLADALNWAGQSEEEFQAKLDACNTEAEREQLIRETLNGLYGDAAANYEKNNAAILAQNEAQNKMNEAMAALGVATAPVMTMLTELGANILATIAPYLQSFAENHLPTIKAVLEGLVTALGSALTFLLEHSTVLGVIATVIGTVVAAIGLYNTVAAVKAAMDAAGTTSIWGLVAAHAAQAVAAAAAMAPYIAIVAAIAAVIAIIVLCIKHWDDIVAAVKAAMTAIWDAIKAGVDWIKGIVDKIIAFVKDNWQGLLLLLVNPFAGAFKLIYDNCEGFRNIVDNVCIAIKDFFAGLWQNIQNIFKGVGQWFSDTFNKAVENIKKVFSTITGFFKSVWDNITGIFKNIGVKIGDAISGAVKGAINKVLSGAVKIINGFINAINFAIGIINAIPGVNIKKLSQLKVPQLEKGGVLKKGQVGLLEGNGTEAVVPLEKNTEWLDKIADRLNSSTGNAPIILQVDGKTLAEISCDSINQLTRQKGKLPLVLA